MTEERLQELVEQLIDPDGQARASAAHELGKMGRKAEPAIHELIESLRDNWDVHKTKAEALGSIGDKAIQALIHKLGVKGHELVYIERALVIIGKKAAPLLVATWNKGELRTPIEGVLRKIHPVASLGQILAGLDKDGFKVILAFKKEQGKRAAATKQQNTHPLKLVKS